jgi:hypothetical protein
MSASTRFWPVASCFGAAIRIETHPPLVCSATVALDDDAPVDEGSTCDGQSAFWLAPVHVHPAIAFDTLKRAAPPQLIIVRLQTTKWQTSRNVQCIHLAPHCPPPRGPSTRPLHLSTMSSRYAVPPLRLIANAPAHRRIVNQPVPYGVSVEAGARTLPPTLPTPPSPPSTPAPPLRTCPSTVPPTNASASVYQSLFRHLRRATPTCCGCSQETLPLLQHRHCPRLVPFLEN